MFFDFNILIKYKLFQRLYIFLNQRWLFDIIYNLIIAHNIMRFCKNSAVIFLEKGFLEFCGSFISVLQIRYMYKKIGFILFYTSGYITMYFLLLGIIGLFIFLVVKFNFFWYILSFLFV